jgi:flagellar assembly factor FliW
MHDMLKDVFGKFLSSLVVIPVVVHPFLILISYTFPLNIPSHTEIQLEILFAKQLKFLSSSLTSTHVQSILA